MTGRSFTEVITSESFPQLQEYTLSPDAVCVIIWDGSSRIIDLNGKSIALNGTATRLLIDTLTAGPHDAIQATSRATKQPVDKISADHGTLFAQLVNHCVVSTKQVTRPSWLVGWRESVFLFGLKAMLRPRALSQPQLISLMMYNAILIRSLGWARAVRISRQAITAMVPKNTAGHANKFESFDYNIRTALAACPLPVDCKVRALTSATILAAHHMPAEIVIGLDLFPFLGHCWCQCFGKAVADRDDRAVRFPPIMHYRMSI